MPRATQRVAPALLPLPTSFKPLAGSVLPICNREKVEVPKPRGLLHVGNTLASRPPGDCRCSALGHLPHQVTKLKAQHVPVCLQPASPLGLSVWRPPVGTLVLTQSTITDTQEKPGSCLPACVFREHQTPWESWDPDTWDQDP